LCLGDIEYAKLYKKHKGDHVRQIALVRGAKILVEVCAAVRAGEKQLIVTDLDRPFSVAKALALAGENVGAIVTIIIMKAVLSGQEVPDQVEGAMLSSDVIFGATTSSLVKTKAAKNAIKAGARLISLTEIAEDLLISGAILADFEGQGHVVEKVSELLTQANEAHITSPGGTNLTMSLEGREGMKVTSLAREPGTKTAAPNLEAFIAPVEGSAEGILVVDASASNIGIVHTPICMEVKSGRVVNITGGAQAHEVEKTLSSTEHDGSYVVAELGIGLNPMGLVRGHIVEDEGVYGTAHIGLGDNTSFIGGKNNAPIHFDYVFWDPTIELDGEVIIDKGKLVNTV